MRLAAQAPTQFGAEAADVAVNIDVHPSKTFQTIDGFGGALTDSAAWVISQSPQRAALLSDLFGPSGAHFSIVRLPVGASDLSTSAYTYDDQLDPSLSRFSIAHDQRYIIPVLRQAQQLMPGLKVLGAPWSAPGWMKYGRSLIGPCDGRSEYLQTRYIPTYARYLTRFVQSYTGAGVPIWMLSLQNEPRNCNTTYPTMRMNPIDQATLATTLRSTLDTGGLGSVGILAWDHNWWVDNSSTWAQDTLNATPRAAAAINAVGYHCYSGAGGYVVQTTFHTAFPNKGIYFTECSGFDASNAAPNLVWALQNDLIGPLRNWAKASLYWSLALNSAHGPHVGGCSNCRGLITVNADGSYTKNEEYYAWAHFSRFVQPGAVRIESSTSGSSALQNVAFRNPDGSIVLVVVNGDLGAGTSFQVRVNGQAFRSSLPAAAVITYKFAAPTTPTLATYNGHIVQWDGDTKTQKTAWLVRSGKRYWIPDGYSYYCFKNQGAAGPDVLPSYVLDSLPDQSGQQAQCIPPASSFEGHIVQWDGDTNAQKTAWLVRSGMRYWIPDAATYFCLKNAGAPGPDVLPFYVLDALPDQNGQWAHC